MSHRQIQDAYIVAATRTPVGKAPKGVFRNTRPDDLLAHALRHLVAQIPSIDLNQIDDVVVGCAMPEAEQGMNVGRIATLLADPSGLAAMATAAQGFSAHQTGAADRTMAGLLAVLRERSS